jgi:hypothetical protein
MVLISGRPLRGTVRIAEFVDERKTPLATFPSWSVRTVLESHGMDKLAIVMAQIPLAGSCTSLADVWKGSTFGLLKLRASDQMVIFPSTFTFTVLAAMGGEMVTL